MPDELITIFKICFLVLLYLFFFPRAACRVDRGHCRARRSGTGSAAESVEATEAGQGPSQGEGQAGPIEPTVPTRLVAVDPPHLAGIEYPLGEGMSIGRGGDSTVVIEDSFLSTRHAAFEHRDGEWVVEDEGSTNGTYVNNVKVERIARLHLGDRVQVGNVILEVQ
ncbi:MAG: FHA domain-containing protein [Microthrixaceae bacterium]